MNRRILAQRPVWRFSLGLVVLIVLSFWIVCAAQGTDPWGGPDSDLIATGPVMVEQTLTDNRAKADAQEQQEQQNRTWATQHSEAMEPKDPNRIVPTAQPEPTVVAGIYQEFSQPMGWGTLYDVQNMWMGPVSGGHIQVYAGLKSDEVGRFVVNGSGQGVIAVLAFPYDSASNIALTGGEYLSPTRTGSLHITAASGICLSLTSTNGTQYAFDVTTRTWSCGTTNGPNP